MWQTMRQGYELQPDLKNMKMQYQIHQKIKFCIHLYIDIWKNTLYLQAFCFISIVWVRFSHETEKFRFWNSMKCFNIFWYKKRYGVRFEYVPWKNVWFCFIFSVSVHFSHETEKFRFWKSMKYFNIFLIKKIMSDLIMAGQTVSDLVKASLFE